MQWLLRLKTLRRRTWLGCALVILFSFALFISWRSVWRRAVLDVPPPTLLFEDAEGRYLAELSKEEKRHGYWPLPEKIPERVEKAALAAEDARFYSHDGVDKRALVRALWQNTRALRRVSGGSTIAMQVARIQHPGGRTLTRKASEAFTAQALVARYGHDAVLRHYLTIAPYGNQNYGVVYAARRYLDKPLEDLTWAEAVLLASLPKLPGRMNIYRPDGWFMAERRAKYVLGRLRALGWITADEQREALDQLPQLRLASKEARPTSCLHAILAVEKELRRKPEAWRPTSKYVVRTSINLDVQDMVAAQAFAVMPELRKDGAGNLAVIVAERNSGRVLAYLGSEDYFDQENKGSIDYARVRRSSGSTLKPFIYALGMTTKGYTAATLLTDAGLPLDARTGGYTIKNYDEAYLGPILYRNALANSRNVPAAQVLDSVGVETAYRHLFDLGLARRWRDPRHYGLGLAVGALYVTLWDLVRAYGVLATDGRPYSLTFTPSPSGPKERPGRLIPEDVARQITIFLSDPMARLPSFPRMGWLEYPFPVAVKTGTSQGYRDAWCVAYSGKYLAGAWVGHPDNFPMKRRCGADSAAMLVHRILERLHPEAMDGLENLSFPPPRGFVSRRIDLLSGKLAGEETPYAAVEWFRPGTEPVETTDVYRRVDVDVRTGKPAAEGCPKELMRTKTFVFLEPRFAAWARQSGLELPPLELWGASGPDLLSKDPVLTVREPRDGAKLLGDPETPPELATISLQAAVEPPVPQVVWVVDGKSYEVVDYPYTTRWKLSPGEHTFQVRLPYAPLQSPRVSVVVQQ